MRWASSCIVFFRVILCLKFWTPPNFISNVHLHKQGNSKQFNDTQNTMKYYSSLSLSVLLHQNHQLPPPSPVAVVVAVETAEDASPVRAARRGSHVTLVEGGVALSPPPPPPPPPHSPSHPVPVPRKIPTRCLHPWWASIRIHRSNPNQFHKPAFPPRNRLLQRLTKRDNLDVGKRPEKSFQIPMGLETENRRRRWKMWERKNELRGRTLQDY